MLNVCRFKCHAFSESHPQSSNKSRNGNELYLSSNNINPSFDNENHNINILTILKLIK